MMALLTKIQVTFRPTDAGPGGVGGEQGKGVPLSPPNEFFFYKSMA